MTLPASSPSDRPPEGISLEELAQAFAEVMGKPPGQRTPSGPAAAPVSEAAPAEEDRKGEAAAAVEDRAEPETVPGPAPEAEDPCPISPRSIFEAMLFVGNRENRPLPAAKAAELMRDVAAEEIPLLVEELNARYRTEHCPYRVVSKGEGYRLALKKEFTPVRVRMYGKIRDARLSQAAIDVLAIVAYKQPLNGEQVGRLRGKPSSHILAHLVRRGLLQTERSEGRRRWPLYRTTERFLRFFNLRSLDELPHSEEPE
ncbi:MAG: SMC-Scp complex subunit ScpB [Pirellulales bacterium]|nr:SMC-Scp complex subunit ScpB [Pirellulales bacterium]